MTQKEQKSGFIPYIFFIFFGIVFLVDAAFIYASKKTWRGEFTESGYQKGKDYNKTILAVKKQKELGWKMDIGYKKIGENFAEIKVCVTDSLQKPLKNAKLVAKLIRPTQEGFDFKQDFMEKNDCYVSKIKFPLSGVWDTEIQVFKDKNVMQQVKRYVVR